MRGEEITTEEYIGPCGRPKKESGENEQRWEMGGVLWGLKWSLMSP